MSRSQYGRDIAKAFVDEINARTYCAHCGAQPVEWHNPSHVQENRQGFRISTLASNGRADAIPMIQAEMEICTPLCRKCHMAEDGRAEETRQRNNTEEMRELTRQRNRSN